MDRPSSLPPSDPPEYSDESLNGSDEEYQPSSEFNARKSDSVEPESDNDNTIKHIGRESSIETPLMSLKTPARTNHATKKLRVDAESSSDDDDTPLCNVRQPIFRPRSSSLPIVLLESEADFIFSPRTEKKIGRQAAHVKRVRTLTFNRIAKHIPPFDPIKAAYDNALETLEKADCTLVGLLEYVFNPQTMLKGYDWRWKGFFKNKITVHQVLRYWSTSASTITVREMMKTWVVEQAQKIAGDEAAAIGRDGILSKAGKVVDEKYFLDFSILSLSSSLRKLAPHFYSIIEAFSTTTRQKGQLTGKWIRKKSIMESAAVLTLLRSRSQNNNYSQSVLGTYLIATGAQRQHTSVLSSLGASVGYGGIIDQRKPITGQATRLRTEGILSRLSVACRQSTRKVASSGLYVVVCDNINMMIRVAEQVLGRKDAQENGTCATVVPLHNAKLEDLEARKFEKRVLEAEPLKVEQLQLSDGEAVLMRNALIHTVLEIIVNNGGKNFHQWQDEVRTTRPESSNTIPIHKTPLHPLPSMEIDESTITGNVEVVEAINKELGVMFKDGENPKYVQIIAGDQLTIARQRSILNIRVGHEDGTDSWKHIVLMPGLFHAKIADCHGLLITHFGIASAQSPGSLAYHNSCMDRLPIVLSSLPSFRVCRDLIFISLYARILCCLLLVSKTGTLEEYTSTYNLSDLRKHSEEIFETYTNADRVEELREPRQTAELERLVQVKEATNKGGKVQSDAPGSGESLPQISEPLNKIPVHERGDMVLENGMLFIRDALFTRLFADGIKSGDSGMVILVLKMWASAYRGSGRAKYAHEMLHLFHNLVNIWSVELRAIITQNWLLNPTGKADAFVEIDLVQEHLNFWIKKIYKADGDAHSWDWLALVSPCIDILRQLASKLNGELGTKQGTKHSAPEIAKDIGALMTVLKEHEVYVLKPGRVLHPKDAPIPDILMAGMSALTHGTGGNPIAEFNEQFNRLRERRKLAPVSTHNTPDPASVSIPPSSHMPPLLPPVADVLRSDQDGAERGVTSLDANDESDGGESNGEELSDYDKAEEFEVGSPTLTRLEADDVALEMDDFELECESDDEFEWD